MKTLIQNIQSQEQAVNPAPEGWKEGKLRVRQRKVSAYCFEMFFPCRLSLVFMKICLLYISQQKRKLKLQQNVRLGTFPGFCITKGS
jgi:hypothetical protein